MKQHIIQTRLLTLSLLGLSACQTLPDKVPLQKRLASWQGATIDEIVQAWGVPVRQSFGTRYGFAEWEKSKTKHGPNISIGLGSFGSHIGGTIGTTIPGIKSEDSCIVQVQFNQQKVAVSVSTRGAEKLCEPLVPERNF